MTILRALSSAIKLPSRLPLGDGRGISPGLGSVLGRNIQSGMDAYTNAGAAYGPIKKLCQSVALTDWKLYQQTKDKSSTNRKLIDDATAPARHPATALWTQPNPYMTRRFFLFLSELYKVTGGGVYWVIVQGGAAGSPYPAPGLEADIELWPIRRDAITPVEGTTEYIAGYLYTRGREQIPLPVQAVIPIGWPDPHAPLQFAGPLGAIGTDLEAERYASQHNRNVFLNSGAPGGVIEFAEPIGPDRMNELVMRWRERHQGVNNAARVAVIEGGKWVETGQKNADMEYIAGRKFIQQEVMFTLGMPYSVMLTENVNLANATIGQKMYQRETVRPELEDIKEPLNLRVLPLLADSLTMDYEQEEPEDEAFDVYASATGWLAGLLSKNEGRAGMGYGAEPDGDMYIYELPGATQPTLPPPPAPPRRPTRLSYRSETRRLETPQQESLLSTFALPMLDATRQQYLDLLNARNGKH